MDWILWMYRQAYLIQRGIVNKLCPVNKPYEKVGVHKDNLPWFWIGILYNDGGSHTITDIINNSIDYDMHITPQYIRHVSEVYGGIIRYMDAETLEEKDFPSDGFIIRNVKGKSVSSSE